MTHIYVSLVSGTYNRLTQLKNMVKSFRLSIGVGIPYEIVLVDGGSSDGTIEWCKSQEDIVLIQQGKLVGAVKAFRAGFDKAVGKYVIIGNDDIEFINESVRCAVSFMDDRMDVGIGCFWQDRNNKPWHVEYLQAKNLSTGNIEYVPYGQVCIIPRWLGNKAGWWGEDYHTYAGDNELSCNVWEMGYKVEAIPCACIHDLAYADDLRAKNNSYPAHKVHPDSAKYLNKWNQGWGVGPEIPETMKIRQDSRPVRVLYAPIYERGNILQHKTKKGLREALTAAGYLVDEVDYFVNPQYIFDAANAFLPDVFLTQFHDGKLFTPAMMVELKQEHPNAVFFNWNGDYFPQNFLAPDYMALMKKFDMTSFVTTDVDRKYFTNGIPWMVWQIGYERVDEDNLPRVKSHDVVFLGNAHYEFRNELGKILRSLPCDVGIYGKWPESYRADGECLYDFEKGHALYKNCKIAISDGRLQAVFVSNRIFQAMYAGAFVMQQWFPGIYDFLGLKEGVHFVTYKNVKDLPALIDYWLKPENAQNRQKIAKRGQEEILHQHSFDARVAQFSDVLYRIAQGKIHP